MVLNRIKVRNEVRFFINLKFQTITAILSLCVTQFVTSVIALEPRSWGYSRPYRRKANDVSAHYISIIFSFQVLNYGVIRVIICTYFPIPKFEAH